MALTHNSYGVQLSLILAAFLTVAEGARAQTAKFHFSPPSGLVFTETKERRFITEVVGIRQKQVREETGASSWTIQKHGSQWLFIERNGPMTARINGKPFDTPANKLVAGLIATNTISSDGKVVQIRFDKDVLREAKRIFPTNYHALLEKELASEGAERMERGRWDELVTPLVGKTVTTDTMLRRQSPLPQRELSLSPTIMHRVILFPKIFKEDDKTLVKVLVIGCSEESILNRFTFKGAQSIYDPVVKEFLDHTVSGRPFVKSCFERTIEADTMLCRTEDEITQKLWLAPRGLERTTDIMRRRYQFQGGR